MQKAKKFPSKAGIFFSEKFPLFRLPVIIISAGNILAYNMTLQIGGILKLFYLQHYRRPISPFNPFFLFKILLMKFEFGVPGGTCSTLNSNILNLRQQTILTILLFYLQNSDLRHSGLF